MSDLINQHLDIWTSAIASKATAGRGTSTPSPKGEGRGEGNPTNTRNAKVTAYGIKKLRELILELAVRGKLVAQYPHDEPASTLLKAIIAEKNKLINERKIKKEKPLTSVIDEEKPFELPNGWEWCYLKEVCVLENGDRSKNYPNKSFLVDFGVPFVNAGHLQNGRINKDEMTFITEERFELLNSGKFVDGDILFCLRGSLGKSAIVEGFDKGAIASSLVIVRLFGNLERYYFHNFFDSPFLYQLIRKYDNGTAQPNLSAADLGKFLVPIPPLAEQHRIVAKVDELMALCDQLEQQQTDNIAAHQTLVQTLLDTLTQAADAAEFEQAWDRIADHFDTLFTTESSIDQLKQTLLQLAVMGKLVSQVLSDEPASQLLKQIHEKKELLLKEGMKKQALLPAISEEEITHEIPNGWVWCRLQEITRLITDGKHGDCNNLPNSGYFFLSAKDIQDGNLIYEHARQIEPSEFNEVHKRTDLQPGDICMVNTGATVGKLAIADDNENTRRTTFQKSVAVIKVVTPFIDQNFIALFLRAENSKLQKKSGGSAINNLLLGDLKKKTVLLPPANEQRRIVAKVDELMALCNALKARIAAAQTTQLQLADAIVEQAVA
ncbi:MAG: restriction endonuclease subunit S [Methylomicrobium sp.]